jgi:hypothetical protein
MPRHKPHLEFCRVDLSIGWETMNGYPVTIQQKVLASDFDEMRKVGGRTRLIAWRSLVDEKERCSR